MKKRKIRRTMGVFFTTFLLLQIILLFLYKAFIVDIAKKNEENLVENTLQIYHNTMAVSYTHLDVYKRQTRNRVIYPCPG